MAQGTIVTTWQDATHAYTAVRVPETERNADGQTVTVNIEYIGAVPLADLAALKTDAERTNALVAAAKAERDRARGLSVAANQAAVDVKRLTMPKTVTV